MECFVYYDNYVIKDKKCFINKEKKKGLMGDEIYTRRAYKGS